MLDPPAAVSNVTGVIMLECLIVHLSVYGSAEFITQILVNLLPHNKSLSHTLVFARAVSSADGNKDTEKSQFRIGKSHR